MIVPGLSDKVPLRRQFLTTNIAHEEIVFDDIDLATVASSKSNLLGEVVWEENRSIAQRLSNVSP